MVKFEIVEWIVVDGDFVVMDYVGVFDGELFEGGEGCD